MSWADRIAYVCHDFEDAVAAGIVAADDAARPSSREPVRRPAQPPARRVHRRRWSTPPPSTGRVGMTAPTAEALAAFRQFNYEHVYLRPASAGPGRRVIALLRALVEHYADRPNLAARPIARTGSRPAATRRCAPRSPTSAG